MEQKPTTPNVAHPDDPIHLRDTWNLLIRNWLVISASLILCVGASVAYTLYVVPVYESVTTIQIEEEQSNIPVLDILQTISKGSQVETEMEVVRSRTLTEGVVDSLGLQVQLEAPRGVARALLLGAIYVERWAPEGLYVLDRQPDGSYSITEQETQTRVGTASVGAAAAVPGATFTLRDPASEHEQIIIDVAPFELAVQSLRHTLAVVRPNREAAIITVRYESTDTQLVHQIPNALASRYISDGRLVRKAEATSTVTFLEDQIDTLSIQLRQSEEALTGFREVEQVVSLQAEADAQVTNMSRLQADRNQIEAERDALQTMVAAVDLEAALADPADPSPYTKLISFPTLFRNQAASEMLRSLNAAVNERSGLLQRRTLQDPDVMNMTGRIQDIETQLRNTAITYLQGLENQVDGYDAMLEQFGADLERIPETEVQLMRLEREKNVLEEIYTLLQQRLQEARILEAVQDVSVRVVDLAILPPEPVTPRKALNLLLGLILGGIFGVGIAFTREYMDETVHTREDIQAATGGAPILGMIPRIRQAGLNGKSSTSAMSTIGGVGELGARLVAGRDPRNPVSEAYRSLRTNLTFSNPDKPPKIIVFTSPLPQDGKSTTAANLAITLTQQGIKTLLIDADLRRGLLHGVFGVNRDPGLTNVLAGGAAISEAIQEIDLQESGKLDFMSSGPYPPNPAEILGSQRMKSLLEALDERYDLVLIDSAPLTVVTDAAVLGTKADGVVLVARANVTEKGALTYAAEQLRNVRAPILGCVLNDVDYRRDSRYYSTYGKYGYYHHYYYGDDGDKKKKKKA
ncbi:MAG: polysaccharide biosynthesis tyrosine autokinase [Gemmatimonadales bacterium]|nr:polysaccharide biosynthesis tyrosine autokinase [Gemmatimonadales bacterium]